MFLTAGKPDLTARLLVKIAESRLIPDCFLAPPIILAVIIGLILKGAECLLLSLGRAIQKAAHQS